MKNSIKLTLAVVTTMAFVGMAYAVVAPSETENQYIQLGYIQGNQTQLTKDANALRQEKIDFNIAIDQKILDKSTQWQTMESERIALSASLFQ